jgi:hypothetical protein
VTSLGVLERFARQAAAALPAEVERCELCGQEVPPGHRHLFDRQRRALGCACQACFLLLDHPEALGGRYGAIPDRVLVDPAFIADAAARLLPVGLAFVSFDSSSGAWVAAYPSAAGATRAPMPPETWGPLATAPLVRALAPDVEALLLFRRLGAPLPEAFLAPLDVCYALVGLLRRQWRGLSGGSELWREVDAFFAALRQRARPLAEAAS